MASKFVQLTENERLYSRQTIKFSIYDNGPRSIPPQEPFLLFHASHFPCHANTSIHAMQLVTPSAVAMADSTLMAVWIANFQNVLFFMVIMF